MTMVIMKLKNQILNGGFKILLKIIFLRIAEVPISSVVSRLEASSSTPFVSPKKSFLRT